MFVYAIVNRENQKVYIGKTTAFDLKVYLRQKVWSALSGRYKGRSHLFAAMRKYHSDVWSIQPIISCLTTDWQLCLWERALIYAFGSTNPEVGYNICLGGEGRKDRGWHHTEETRIKMSKTHSMMRAEKAKIAKESWLNPKTRTKRVKAIRKSMANPVTLSNKSKASKKLWSDSIFHAKQVEAIHAPQPHAKMIASLKKLWADPLRRIRHSKITKQGMARPEVRAKISAARKRRPQGHGIEGYKGHQGPQGPRRRNGMTKLIKVWKYGPVETRKIADYLNAATLGGDKVFGVYPSATTSGSLDVLTYHEKRVPVGKPAPADAPQG